MARCVCWGQKGWEIGAGINMGGYGVGVLEEGQHHRNPRIWGSIPRIRTHTLATLLRFTIYPSRNRSQHIPAFLIEILYSV